MQTLSAGRGGFIFVKRNDGKHREDNRYVKCIELLGELLHHNFLVRVIENPEFVDVQKYDVYYEIFHDEIKKSVNR